jgi:hypothetical protein
MDALTRRFPFGLTGMDLDANLLVGVAQFYLQNIPVQDDGDSLVRVAMPGHGLSGIQNQAAHSSGSVTEEFFVCHKQVMNQQVLCRLVTIASLEGPSQAEVGPVRGLYLGLGL